MQDVIYTRPILAYPVAYAGAFDSGYAADGPEIIIPKRHKRAGDDYENRVVEYFITFDGLVGGSFIYVYDNNNVVGLRITGASYQFPIRLVMDSDLRMKVFNSITATYNVMAFYEMPPGR